MGLFIDSKKNVVISVGEDKMLKITDLTTGTITHEIQCSNHKLTNLIVDNINKTAFITDRGGNITIYDLSLNHERAPGLMLTIQTPSAGRANSNLHQGTLRTVEINFHKQLLFTSCFDDGYIYIYK